MKNLYFVLLLSLTITWNLSAGTYSGGSGSEADPYQIATLNDLRELSETIDDWSSNNDFYFVQTANIDASATNTWNGGAGFSPIGNESFPFYGHYNGNNKTINEIYINQSTSNRIGLFGQIRNAEIIGLGITNANIQGARFVGGIVGWEDASEINNCNSTGNVNGVLVIGGIAGYISGQLNNCYSLCTVSCTDYIGGGLVGDNFGRIKNCHFSGIVNGNNVGGITGGNSNYISNSYNSGSINGGHNSGGIAGFSYVGAIYNCYNNGNISGTYGIGGIIGDNTDGNVLNCYNLGSVSGNYDIGGVVGRISNGSISNCYNISTVSGTYNVGGLVGSADDYTFSDIVLSNLFWDTQTSGTSVGVGDGDSSGTSGKLTSEMKTLATFTDSGWDFVGETTNGNDDYWSMNSQINTGYPFLNWETLSCTTAPATNIGNFSATLGGIVTSDGDHTVTERGIVYSSSDASPTIGEAGVTKDTNGSGNGTFNENIGSLSQGTTYYFQTYAINSTGTKYGGVNSFTTLTLPYAICNDTTVYLNIEGNANIDTSYVNNGSGAYYEIQSISIDVTDFTCSEINTNTVELKVIDINEDTSVCEATVTVLDTISPDFAECSNLNDTIDCLGEIENELAAAEWDSLNFESLEDCVIDNCEIDTVKSDYDWANFVDSCCNAGGLTVVYTAVDISGNSSTFTAYLSIIDTMPPTFTAPNDTTIYVDENCEYDSDVVYTGDVTDESDICCETLDATYSDVVVAGNCPGNWIITRTWSLIDGCGNEADDQIQIINVEDTIPPDVVCNAIEIVLYENGEHTLHEGEIIAMAAGTTDNCTSFEDLEIIVEPRGFECIHVGEPVDVKVTVIDLCGNEASCWTTVTVYDETPPIALCKDLDLVLDESGEARINPSMVNAGDGNAIPPGWARTYNGLASGSYDACGISLLNIDQYNFDCSDIGENTVTLTVVDAHGNTSTCESTVTVSDNMVPVIEPVSDVELVIEPGSCDSELEYPTLVIHDNCETTQELVEGLGSNGMFPVGTTTETWKVTDDAGNTAMVSFDVTIVATNAQPTINEQTDITVVEDTYSVDVTLTGISEGDDCEEQEVMITANGDNPDLITSVMVDYTTGDSTGIISMMIAPEMSGEAEIVVAVEDEEGGITADTFTVTVTPVNDAPYLVATIADQSVHASHVLKVPVSPVLGELFDDVDDDMLTIKVMAEGSDSIPHWATMMGDTLVFEPLIADTGCVNIVITASDDGGLSVSDTFEVCVDGFPVSIAELGMNSFEVQMYPNPTRGIVNMEMSSGIYEVQLSVHDITGKVVLRKQYSAQENITFDMSDKVSGMYFVKMNIDGNQIVKKLIIDKK